MSKTASPTAMGRLRAETRSQHLRLESAIGLERIATSRTAYTRFLSCFHGVHLAAESRLSAIALPADLEMSKREKLPALTRDLLALGVGDDASLGKCETLPQVHNLEEALGLLYVLEGATLGGQIIAREVRKKVGDESGEFLNYLTIYGPHVGAMWRAFGNVVELHLNSRSQTDRCVHVAQDTFDAIFEWASISGVAH